VTVPDEVSSGEVYRRLQDHEQRTDRAHAALDSRITSVARDAVPLALFKQEGKDRDRELARLEQEHDEGMQQLRREHAEDITQVRRELRELRERPGMTLGRWLGVATVVAAFLALAVQAFGTLRGVK
jgi:hypothetical protein